MELYIFTGYTVLKDKKTEKKWNIAERLGSKKDYTGEVRAIFIKRMFPDVMRDIELDSIRNFKFQPDTGSIVIDEPDKGDYHFHFV